jgi:hypothetical protein
VLCHDEMVLKVLSDARQIDDRQPWTDARPQQQCRRPDRTCTQDDLLPGTQRLTLAFDPDCAAVGYQYSRHLRLGEEIGPGNLREPAQEASRRGTPKSTTLIHLATRDTQLRASIRIRVAVVSRLYSRLDKRVIQRMVVSAPRHGHRARRAAVLVRATDPLFNRFEVRKHTVEFPSLIYIRNVQKDL